MNKFMSNSNISNVNKYYSLLAPKDKLAVLESYINQPISFSFTQSQKISALIDVDVKLFNKVVFEFLKTTDYPVGKLNYFPLVDDDELVTIDEVFNILKKSGVGIPAYYKPIEYKVEIDGVIKTGKYSRSRSGCFFCFYQQKIEWVWLLEQHPRLYSEAMKYEKEGYTWSEEPLAELSKPDRVKAIKKEHFLRMKRQESKTKSDTSWQDAILDAEGEGCASCFI